MLVFPSASCVCATLTSVRVVEVDELLPLVPGEETEHSPLQRRAHLDDELDVGVDGVTGRDEGGVQRPAEGGQGVHGLLVVEAEDGVHASGELGADWKQKQEDRKRTVSSRQKHSRPPPTTTKKKEEKKEKKN